MRLIMTKRWIHEVSREWLNARKDVLTASDIVKMLPEYKRHLKKPGDPSPGFIALAYEKLSNREPDTTSNGAAARGHIMEPYAIEEWNMWWTGKQVHHWDDIIIKRNGLGFSPDGLDIPQMQNMGVSLGWSEKNKCLVCQNTTFAPPKYALEVKCYEPKQHAKAILTDPREADERWQVAVAFMVLPSLENAYVMWYCPDSPVPMAYNNYTRADLNDEIKIITDMVKLFHESMKYVKGIIQKVNGKETCQFTEEEIYKEFLETQSEHFISI